MTVQKRLDDSIYVSKDLSTVLGDGERIKTVQVEALEGQSTYTYRYTASSDGTATLSLEEGVTTVQQTVAYKAGQEIAFIVLYPKQGSIPDFLVSGTERVSPDHKKVSVKLAKNVGEVGKSYLVRFHITTDEGQEFTEYETVEIIE